LAFVVVASVCGGARNTVRLPEIFALLIPFMMIGSVTMNNFDPAATVGEHDKHRSRDASGELGSLLKKSSAQSSARYWLPFFINLLKVSDVVVLLLAGFGGFFVRFGLDAKLTTAGHLFIYLSTLVIIVSLHCAQAYREREILSLNSLLGKLGLGFFSGLSLIMIVGYLSGTLSEYSRVWVATSACAWFVLLLANRLILTRLIYRARMANLLDESIIIVGANERAELIVNAIRRSGHANIRVFEPASSHAGFDVHDARLYPHESCRPCRGSATLAGNGAGRGLAQKAAHRAGQDRSGPQQRGLAIPVH
jgi:hypothetical protein